MTARGLIARVLVERRRVLLPLGIAALVNLGVYALAVYPLSLKVALVRAPRRRPRGRSWRRPSATRRRRAPRCSRAEQADADLQRFYRETLPSSIEGARRMSYAKLASLADHHGLVIERRSYDRDSGYRGRLHKLKITMALSGEYRDIRAFLHALETSPEFIVIEDVVAQPRARARGAAVAGRASWRPTTLEPWMAPNTRRQLGDPGGAAGHPAGGARLQPREPTRSIATTARDAAAGRPTRATQAVDVEVVRLDALDARAPGDRRPAAATRFASGPQRRRRRQPTWPAGARRRRRAPALPAGPPVPVGPPPPPPIALKFIGVVEQAPSRLKLAVLSDGRNVFYGKEGEVIEGRYRIERIGVESIEMAYVDGRGRQTLRLSGS